MTLFRTILLAIGLVVGCTSAHAQWQTPNHSVPVGRGGGATGFGSVSGANGQALFGVTGANPVFRAPRFSDLADVTPGINGQALFGVTGASPAFRAPTFSDLTGSIDASQVSTTSPRTGAVARTQAGKNADVVNAADFGVVCDGVTDNTAAFAVAIASFPLTAVGGGTLWLPQGVCIGILNVSRNVQVRGTGSGNLSVSTPTGVCGTEIRSSGAADNVVTLSGLWSGISDVCVSSSVATASRVGDGIATNGSSGVIERVLSYGHNHGISVTNSGGLRVLNSFSVSNKSHGVWQTGANNEDSYVLVQSNGNGGDGFRIEGSGLGTRLTNTTSASNTGFGINIPGNATDVWLYGNELSNDVAGEINLANVSDIQVLSCFCEGGATLLTITNSSSVSVTGGFYQGGPYGVVVGGSNNVAVSGITFFNQTLAAMRHGVGSSQTSYTGNTTRGAVVGVLIDATSGTMSFVGNSLEGATTPVSGSANIAANSSFCANTPISTTTQGAGKCY